MVGAGAIEDALHLRDLALGPLRVRRPAVLADGPEDGEQAEGHHRLLVDDQELVGHAPHRHARACRQDRRLGDQRVAGQLVEQRLRARLGVLAGHAGSVSALLGGQGLEGWRGGAGKGVAGRGRGEAGLA